MAVLLIHPGGMQIGPIRQIQGPQRFTLGQTQILLYYGEPSPYSPYQEIYLDFLPVRDYVDSGIWTVRLIPQRIVTGRYDMVPGGRRFKRRHRIPSAAGGDDAPPFRSHCSKEVVQSGRTTRGSGSWRDFARQRSLPETDRSSRILRRRAWRSPPARRAEAIPRVRNFDGNPVCDEERGTSDGVGDCARKRCVPVRRKNKGVPDPRSASARRRKGFWSAAGISESMSGVGELYVCRTVCRSSRENGKNSETQKKKITWKLCSISRER